MAKVVKQPLTDRSVPLPAAVVAMDLSQYVTQALWNDDGTLLQLPHFTKDLVAQCKAAGKTEVLDIAEMEVSCPVSDSGVRSVWLGLSDAA